VNALMVTGLILYCVIAAVSHAMSWGLVLTREKIPEGEKASDRVISLAVCAFMSWLWPLTAAWCIGFVFWTWVTTGKLEPPTGGAK
jgi:hypothetical protein